MNVLLLGLGNILLMDEGVGVRAMEAVVDRYDLAPGVEAADGGTAGMDMLNLLSDRDHIIVLDAVKTGEEPGTLVRLVDEQVPAFFRQKISPHQLSLSDVLATLTLMGQKPPRVTVLGVVPEALGTGMMLSDLISRKCEHLVEMAVEEMAGIGLAPRLKADSSVPSGAGTGH